MKPEKFLRISELLATLALALFFGYAFWFLTALSFKIAPPNIYNFLFVCEFATTIIFFSSYFLSNRLTRKSKFLKSKAIIFTSLFGVNLTYIFIGLLKNLFFDGSINYLPFDYVTIFDVLIWSGIAIITGTLAWLFVRLANFFFNRKLP